MNATEKSDRLHRMMLMRGQHGHTKFNGTNFDLNLIQECCDKLDKESNDFKLNNSKPVIKYYGGYSEMLQLLMLR